MRKNVLIVGLIASGSRYLSGFTLLLSNCSPQARGTIHLPLRAPHKGSAYEHRGSLLANKHWDLTPAASPAKHQLSLLLRYLCTWMGDAAGSRKPASVTNPGETMSCHQTTPNCISTIMALKDKLLFHRGSEPENEIEQLYTNSFV